MGTTSFLRWGRLRLIDGNAELVVHTHTGQGRVVALDPIELGDLIGQATAARAAILRSMPDYHCIGHLNCTRHHTSNPDKHAELCRRENLKRAASALSG